MQIPPAPITWNFTSTSTSTTKGGERGSASGGDGLYVSPVLDPTTLASTLHMQLPFEAIFRPLPPPLSTTSTYHHHTHSTTSTSNNNNNKYVHIHDATANSSNVLYSDFKENNYTYNTIGNATSNNSTGILQWEEYRSGVMDRYI